MFSLLQQLLDPTVWRFSNPEWLRALWAVPAVVLLYLLRRRVAKLLVPHLPLWERVLRRAHRRRPRLIRTLLAILMQITVLTCIVLLLSEPFVSERTPGSGHTVILLDRSLGTRAAFPDGRTLADGVIERGLALARERLAHGTVSVGLLTSDEVRTLVPTTADPALLDLSRVDLEVPSGGRGWQEVAVLAETMAGRESSRIILVSPFRPATRERAMLREAGVSLASAGLPPPNAGIRLVRRLRETLEITVTGSGPDRELALLRGGRRIATGKVALTTGNATLTLPFTEAAGSEPELRLLPPDGFPDDDQVPLSVPERERVRLLVVADVPFPHLDAFLAASTWVDREGSGRIEGVGFRPPAEGVDVVILVGVHLQMPIGGGRYLLLGASAPGLPFTVDRNRSGAAQPVKARREDPLVRALDLSDWVVHGMHPVSPATGLDVVVDGSLGPLVSRGAVSGLRFVHLGVSPDPKASTFPLMAAFPLFMEAAIGELMGAQRLRAPLVVRAGGALSLFPGEEPFLVAQGGSILRLDPVPAGTGWRLPERVGRFTVGGQREARSLAVAILDHVGVPGPGLEEDDPVADFPDREIERWLGPPILLLLIGVLLLEWLLYQLMLTD